MPRTLLIIDDSKTMRRQVVDILQPARLFGRYLEAENGLEGFKLLLAEPVDVVLCDLEMPGMDGLKFLDLHRSRAEVRDIPVILLTGREGSTQKVKGLERGASDYVIKPFDPDELIARVKVQLKIKRLQDHLKEQNRKLEELSNTDALTSLANRRALMDALEKEFQRSTRTGQNLSLIMADIDHFKQINDTYGHQQGDVVLKVVAGVVRNQLRDYDIAARFGGEEFAVILPATDLSGALLVAERIREAVDGIKLGGSMNPLCLTISLGVSSRPGSEIVSVDTLIREADDALYRAKHAGRNRVESSIPSL